MLHYCDNVNGLQFLCGWQWEIPGLMCHAASNKVVGSSIGSPVRVCEWRALSHVTPRWVELERPNKTDVFLPKSVNGSWCVACESIAVPSVRQVTAVSAVGDGLLSTAVGSDD